MLHYRTIDTKTLELLKKLQKIHEFSNLRLVGGTALALQIGHRKSIDLDLFGIVEADTITISKRLKKQSSKLIFLRQAKWLRRSAVDPVVAK